MLGVLTWKQAGLVNPVTILGITILLNTKSISSMLTILVGVFMGLANTGTTNMFQPTLNTATATWMLK
jgi:hypothetical protein